jgi:hypothetical protein
MKEVLLIEGEEAVAAVDDVGEDDEAEKNSLLCHN